MHGIDLAIVCVYLAATLALGLHLSRRVKDSQDLFLAGRRLPFWAIAMSLVVSDIGALEMIGGTEGAFSHGIAQANYEWIGCVPAMIVGGLLFIPLFWKLGIYSVPEYLGQRFGPVVHTIMAVVWLVFLVALLGVFFLAAEKMFAEVLGWERWLTLPLLAGLVGVYTVGGGLGAVVVTDVVQCVVLFIGGLLLAGIGLYEAGGLSGLGEVLEDKPRHLELLIPVGGDTPFPWTGVLLGLGLVLSPAYWLGNPAIVQRTLGARSLWDAKAAMIFGAGLKTFVPLAFVLPGLLGLALLPDAASIEGASVYPRLIEHLLPVGLRGILYAAFLAALMSSLDSYANSAATIFVRDIYLRWRRDPGQDRNRDPLWLGRLTSLLVIVAGAAAVPLADSMGEIYTAFQTYMSFFQGPFLVLLVAGVCWPQASAAGALAALLAGISCSAVLSAQELHFLHVAFWSALAAGLGMITGSIMGPDRGGPA